MDISSLSAFVIGLSYISFTIYRANQDQIAGEWSTVLRWLLYGVVGMMFLYGLFIVQLPLMPAAELAVSGIDVGAATANFVLTGVLCLLSLAVINSQQVREHIRLRLPESATYSVQSPVHAAAWVLSLALICMVTGNFVAGGGISGLAESLENTGGMTFADTLFQQVLWVFAAALGIGLFLRRTPQQGIARLGLRFPTVQDVGWGVGAGLGLFGFIVALSMLWMRLVSPEELQQQTAASSQLARSFGSLPLALMISLVVSLGEEIFFRGAVQAVFGNVLTSLFFAALHTQYLLTPATLAIVVTSLTLGWLRSRYSTTAAIIGHFVYNFIQLAIAVLVGAALQSG